MANKTLAVTPGTGATVNTLPDVGQATKTNSLPVTLASDTDTLTTKPDPSALGAKASASSTSVTPGTDARFPTQTAGISTSALSSVSAVTAGAAGNVLAANPARRRYSVANDSAAVMYLLEGAGVASATSYSVKVQPAGYYSTTEWHGAVSGAWATADGNARVTEYAQ